MTLRKQVRDLGVCEQAILLATPAADTKDTAVATELITAFEAECRLVPERVERRKGA